MSENKDFNNDNILVIIGTITFNFVIRLTNAPEDYDGFNTLTLQKSSNTKKRLVVIQERFLEWQEGRYASGMYTCEKPESSLAKEVAERAIFHMLYPEK